MVERELEGPLVSGIIYEYEYYVMVRGSIILWHLCQCFLLMGYLSSIKKMRILVACEESQAVTIQLRKRGHEAYSCDVLPCSGGHPEWHYEDDVKNVIWLGWEMMIAFPPCTDLAVSGARHFEEKIRDGRQAASIDFFMSLINAPIDKIAVENPIGIMSNKYMKPSQIIQPFHFGDPERKSTCLWLKNLPKLQHFAEDDLFENKTHVEPLFKLSSSGERFTQTHWSGGGTGAERSKTFPGIALAMAKQWTDEV